MVQHEIQNDADTPCVRFADKRSHILHAAENGVDVPVIRDVIPIVVLRRTKDGREPNGIDPERGQIVEPGHDAGQVPNAVAVRVGKAAGIDLINDGRFPPIHACAIQTESPCQGVSLVVPQGS